MPADDSPRTAGSPARDPADVPVFNCHVCLSPANSEGMITGRVTTLAAVVAQGRTEREVLREVVQKFKSAVAGHLARGEPIPWLDPPLSPQPGETQRFVPVHL